MAIYPKEHLAAAPKAVPGTCFILMPFDAQFRKVHAAIRTACESPELQLSCSRADDISKTNHVMEDVLNGISQAEYVIADLTGRNPNVFYELGIAHSCKDVSKVVMITQRAADVPFDLRTLRYFKYRPDKAGLQKLKENLIAAMKGEGYRFSIKKGERYELSDMLFGQGRYLYKFKMTHFAPGAGVAKVKIDVAKYIVDTEELSPVGAETAGISIGQRFKIEPTNWQLRLDRIHDGSGYFSIIRTAS